MAPFLRRASRASARGRCASRRKPARERAKPIAALAADIGISESCLRNWVHKADIDEGRQEGLTSDERRELTRLRRENRMLRMEKEILAKAAAFFANRDELPSK